MKYDKTLQESLNDLQNTWNELITLLIKHLKLKEICDFLTKILKTLDKK